MQTATEIINAEQRARVELAVSAAESKTSCEIVPVVATFSGRYDRAEDIVGLSFAMIGTVVYERTAVVLGDRIVVEALGEKFPEELC